MTMQQRDDKGETVPQQGETQQRVPRAPHERDESASSQAPGEASARESGKQGARDVERGLVDTDKGPALERAYEDVRENAPAPKK
jgi:hypothetical protein